MAQERMAMKGTLIIPSERTVLLTVELESGNHIMWVDKMVNGLLKRCGE